MTALPLMNAVQEQLSLLSPHDAVAPFVPEPVADPRGKLQGYTLFLALFPQPDDAQRIAEAAAQTLARQQLTGKRLAAGRLHVTLHTIDACPATQALAQADIDAASAAAASVVSAPLPLVFDRTTRLAESGAFVLRCDSRSDAAVAPLRQALTDALRHAGLYPRVSTMPHMTLLYHKRHVAEQSIEPLCWTATRFALVLSHVGLQHHQWIGEWPLAARDSLSNPEPFLDTPSRTGEPTDD